MTLNATMLTRDHPGNRQDNFGKRDRRIYISEGKNLIVKKLKITLIYTTFGGWGPQATRYHKRLAEKIAAKRIESYSHVLGHMRAWIRFSLLRSVLVAVRGERGKRNLASKPFSATSFNLVPSFPGYESF